jgi:hypothetical protein
MAGMDSTVGTVGLVPMAADASSLLIVPDATVTTNTAHPSSLTRQGTLDKSPSQCLPNEQKVALKRVRSNSRPHPAPIPDIPAWKGAFTV